MYTSSQFQGICIQATDCISMAIGSHPAAAASICPPVASRLHIRVSKRPQCIPLLVILPSSPRLAPGRTILYNINTLSSCLSTWVSVVFIIYEYAGPGELACFYICFPFNAITTSFALETQLANVCRYTRSCSMYVLCDSQSFMYRLAQF